MPFRFNLPNSIPVIRYLLKWVALTVPLGLLVGTACAWFLTSLDWATQAQQRFPSLLYGLPLAGLAVGSLYAAFGRSVEAGNNLIMDEIHEPGGGVPTRMAPLIWIGTIVTHLFGGSAGREGTAVQLGGSLASGLASLVPRLSPAELKILLMAGVSAGFGGVFGTPLAGTVFAMEVLVIGRLHSAALFPCLLAGILSDQTCLAWNVHHTAYAITSSSALHLHVNPMESIRLLATVAAAGALFGLTSILFAESVHGLNHAFKRGIRWPMLRPVAGGVLVLVLVGVTGTRDYLGLGVSSPDPDAVTIGSCFRPGGAQTWSWLAKLVFTVVTIGSGFKGGEVTPLFFIGAALGNTLAVATGAPVDLFAGLGFLAVFAGATNTPLACTIMGIELFGAEHTVSFALACSFAFLFSGHSGIYLSQRVQFPKHSEQAAEPMPTLRQLRDGDRLQSPPPPLSDQTPESLAPRPPSPPTSATSSTPPAPEDRASTDAP